MSVIWQNISSHSHPVKLKKIPLQLLLGKNRWESVGPHIDAAWHGVSSPSFGTIYIWLKGNAANDIKYDLRISNKTRFKLCSSARWCACAPRRAASPELRRFQTFSTRVIIQKVIRTTCILNCFWNSFKRSATSPKQTQEIFNTSYVFRSNAPNCNDEIQQMKAKNAS